MGQDLLLGDSHKEVKKQLDVVRILPPAAVQKVEVVIVHEHDEATIMTPGIHTAVELSAPPWIVADPQNACSRACRGCSPHL